MSALGPAYVRPVGRLLGQHVALADLDDPVVTSHLETLAAEGVTGAGVFDCTSIELAAALVPSSGDRAVVDGIEPDLVVICTESLEGLDPTGWTTRFQARSGIEMTTTLMVSGHACANLVMGLETCRGLIATGLAETVLLVTVDRISEGTRFTDISRTVFSDGAASCLVTTESGRSFEILGTGIQGQPRVDGTGSMAEARATLSAMGSATTRALGGRRAADVRYALTSNLGTTTRSLLAMAASMPVSSVRAGSPDSPGHCFAADVLLGMEELLADGDCRRGDGAIMLASGRHVQAAMLLQRSGG